MPSYVIVGASRGLGYEWLRQLSCVPDATVVGLVRDISAVKAKLAADGISNINVLAADMVDNDSLMAAAAKTAEITGGSVDYLILNGVYQDPVADCMTATEFIGREKYLHDYMVKSLEVNVIGVMYAINAFLPLIRNSGIKKIIAISTGLAHPDYQRGTTMGFMVTYSAMKAALNMVVVRYSNELRNEGVIFLALSPGLVKTRDEPPPAELIPRINIMMENILAKSPGFKGPILPEESVKKQRDLIEKITLEESGAFISHLGNDTQWV